MEKLGQYAMTKSYPFLFWADACITFCNAARFEIGRALAYFLFILLICFTLSACAPKNLVEGEISARHAYDSNIFRSNQDTVSEWKTIVAPGINFSSAGRHSNMFLHYSPEFVSSQRTNGERVDHNFSLNANASAKHATFSLYDLFVQADEPFSDEETGIILSDRRGRNRYITNFAQADIAHKFPEGSKFSLGYSQQILNNEDPTIDDYRKHTPACSLEYHWSAVWVTEVEYSFTYGDFDLSEDVRINSADFRQLFNHTSTNSYFIDYNFTDIDYDNLQADYYINSVGLGLEKMFKSEASLRMKAGVAQAQLENGSGEETAFWGEFLITKKSGRISIDLSANSGFEEPLFEGSDRANDLSRYWASKLNIHFQLYKNLTSDFHGIYHERKFVLRTPEDNEAYIQAGAAITYSFLRWYTLGLHYMYHQLEADISTAEYEDHQYYIQIAAKKDLWRW